MTTILLLPQTPRPLAAAVTTLAIVLAQINTPACQALVINVDSAKTAQLSGMIAPFIILRLVHKQQKILTPYANLFNPPNPMTLICLHDVLVCCHSENATLTPLITLTTKKVLPNIVSLVAPLAIVHAVVTSMMMIVAASVPLILAMITILDIKMFALLANFTLIF